MMSQSATTSTAEELQPEVQQQQASPGHLYAAHSSLPSSSSTAPEELQRDVQQQQAAPSLYERVEELSSVGSNTFSGTSSNPAAFFASTHQMQPSGRIDVPTRNTSNYTASDADLFGVSQHVQPDWRIHREFTSKTALAEYVRERIEPKWVLNPRLRSVKRKVGDMVHRTRYLLCIHHLSSCPADMKIVTEESPWSFYAVSLVGRRRHCGHPIANFQDLENYVDGG
ncbi:unnamed protein product [Meloidogyne enterolobii]|uniref:Uncharacterized protein n=1 Tax=Meloidogyne enterolobii TaxID=390850 RepID=A0ACB1A5T8_MELEN